MEENSRFIETRTGFLALGFWDDLHHFVPQRGSGWERLSELRSIAKRDTVYTTSKVSRPWHVLIKGGGELFSSNISL